MSNTFGKSFCITSFGESHGHMIGVVISGCPAGLEISPEEIQAELDRRKPGGPSSTTRREDDSLQIISGITGNRTTGAPITLAVTSHDIDSSAYAKISSIPRPGHADYCARIKYGGFSDQRGGGRFSGRITAGFVMAGAIAKKLLSKSGICIAAHTTELGRIQAPNATWEEIITTSRPNELSCANEAAASNMIEAINKARNKGDSLGGIIEVWATGIPVGLGEPVFDTLDGELAKAFFAVPGVKGVEFGAGFASSRLNGSQNNDAIIVRDGEISFSSNNAGGVLGGISNGMPLIARVAIKPTPSIGIPQDSVDLNTMQPVRLEIKGRHDVCILPRAVVVIESMTAVTLVDFAIRAQIIPGVIK